MSDKTGKGLRFDSLQNLQTDVTKFVNENKRTDQTETGANLSVEQKNILLVKAVFGLGQQPAYANRISAFAKAFTDFLETTRFKMNLSVQTTNGVERLGTVNYRQQLVDFFKTNNIRTHSLNPSPPLK